MTTADYHRQRAESLLKQCESADAGSAYLTTWLAEASAHATLAVAYELDPSANRVAVRRPEIVPKEVFQLGPQVALSGVVVGETGVSADTATVLREWANDLLYSVDTDFLNTLGPTRQAYVEAANESARISIVVTALDRKGAQG